MEIPGTLKISTFRKKAKRLETLGDEKKLVFTENVKFWEIPKYLIRKADIPLKMRSFE